MRADVRKDGKKQYSTEVVAHRVHLIQLGEQQAAEPRRETAKAVEGSQEVAEDDIPFYGGVWIARGVAVGQGSVL
jgi:hypothetical protein